MLNVPNPSFCSDDDPHLFQDTGYLSPLIRVWRKAEVWGYTGLVMVKAE